MKLLMCIITTSTRDTIVIIKLTTQEIIIVHIFSADRKLRAIWRKLIKMSFRMTRSDISLKGLNNIDR